MPAPQGHPPGTLGPPVFRPPSNTGTLVYGPPPSFYGPPPGPFLAPVPLAPPGTLPHPSLTRTGFPMPPPGAPGQLPPPQILVEPPAPGGPPVNTASKSNKNSDDMISTIGLAPKLGTHVPLAKCRVLYIGSAVPTKTSVGIDAVQQPLMDRYNTNGAAATNVRGIDSWVTIFSSGMLIQYTGDKSMSTWFPIHTLHVSAAVKCVPQINPLSGDAQCSFLSLDTPAAKSSEHPPIFATIMRRTTGRKVLECHVFICKSEQAALACVQSSTHAYEHKEGWAEEEPPRELYQTLEGTINTSDPTAEPDLPLFQPSEKEFENKPPIKGYFYNSRQDLIQSFNVHHPNEGKKAQNKLMASVVPPPSRMPPPRPLPMVPLDGAGQPMYGTAYSNPYLLPTPAPPSNYFEDWDAFRGQPVMVFPGPYMSDDQYKRTMREVRHKRRPRSPDPRRAPPQYAHDRTHDHRRRYEREPPPKTRTYDRPPPPRVYPELPPPPRRAERPPPEFIEPPREQFRRQGGPPEFIEPPREQFRRQGGPPSDYMDDLGNRYYVGNDEDYGYSYRGEFPRPIERRDYVEPDPDMVLYAPRYMRHIEGDVDVHDRHNGTVHRDPPRYDTRPDPDPRDRYPRNDRDFMHSMMEERRVVGEGDRPDPYKMNDHRGRNNFDMFRDGGYGDLTRDLGYFP